MKVSLPWNNTDTVTTFLRKRSDANLCAPVSHCNTVIADGLTVNIADMFDNAEGALRFFPSPGVIYIGNGKLMASWYRGLLPLSHFEYCLRKS